MFFYMRRSHVVALIGGEGNALSCIAFLPDDVVKSERGRRRREALLLPDPARSGRDGWQRLRVSAFGNVAHLFCLAMLPVRTFVQ